MLRALGVVAGIAAWLGWLTVCPALGFPSLATSAMLERVLAPKDDPSAWPSWVLLFIGLGAAALVYLLVTSRSRLRPGILSGAVYGAICWLIAGAVVMPLLGVLGPQTPSSPTPPPVDAMQGSFMMLTLGIAAPVAALIAWAMFGAVIGGTAAAVPRYDPGPYRVLVVGVSALTVVVLAIGLVLPRLTSPAPAAADTATGTKVLATEHEQAIPKSPDFFSLIELWQPPGAELGPHSHSYFGFAYSLRGVATVAFTDGQTTAVSPGLVCFIGVQAGHAHENTVDEVPSGALALSIVGLAGLVCLLSWRVLRGAGSFLPLALVLLIAAGTYGASNPWSNDWLFVSVRSSTGRGAAMPLATSTRLYESPDYASVGAGPYTETMEEITIAPGDSIDVDRDGSAIIVATDGTVGVQRADGSTTQLARNQGTTRAPGETLHLTNAGSAPAHLVMVTVMSAPPAA